MFFSVSCTNTLLGDRQHDLIRHETNGHSVTSSISFSLFTVRDSTYLSPEISNVRGNGVTNTIARADSFSLCPVREMLAWRTSKAAQSCPRTSRQSVTNAKVPLNLFEDEILDHRSQHKDGPHQSEVDGSGIQ